MDTEYFNKIIIFCIEWMNDGRSMVINPLDNDSPVRMQAIIPLLVQWEIGVF